MTGPGSATRSVLAALTVGAISVAAAWAGVQATSDVTAVPVVADEDRDVVAELLGEGSDGLLAGAARIDIRPRPDDAGRQWQTEGCATLGADAGLDTLAHVPDFDRSPCPSGPTASTWAATGSAR